MDSNEVDYSAKNESIFPVGITIEECREAIKDVVGFREEIRENTIVFNYDSLHEESFPDPSIETDQKKAYLLKVRRECRGLIFCKETNKLLVRKLHKFFNINELPECRSELIKLDSGSFILMDKIDGSLISPMLINDQVYFGSKKGISDLGTMVNDFISRVESNNSSNNSSNNDSSNSNSNKIRYMEFSKKCLEKGLSPLFEFTSPNQPIIIHYKEEKLRLIGIRNIHSGKYMKWVALKKVAQEFNIPTVELIDQEFIKSVKTTTELVEKVKQLRQIEGCVLKFEDSGLMYKIKTNQYIDLARLQLNSPKDIRFEKDIWSLLLSGHYDDVKDTINLICDENEEPNDKIKRIESFSKELFERIDKVSTLMIKSILSAKRNRIQRNQYHLHESSSDLNKKAFTLSIQLFDKIDVNTSIQQNMSLASKFLIDRIKELTKTNSKLLEARSILGDDIKF